MFSDEQDVGSREPVLQERVPEDGRDRYRATPGMALGLDRARLRTRAPDGSVESRCTTWPEPGLARREATEGVA
jgi:hypothetical protein